MEKLKSSMNCPYTFFTYDEVVIHNQPQDFWIVIFDTVLDLTSLIKDRMDSMTPALKYLLSFGGKDLSHFFDDVTRNPLTEISCRTGQKRPVFPAVYESAQSEFCYTKGFKWWNDPLYQIGLITKQERRLRIVNTLTGTSILLSVCEEDQIYDIQAKYKKYYNSHNGSYTWRKSPKNDSNSTRLILDENLNTNGIFYDKAQQKYPPALFLYYNDDLTIA